MTGDTSSAPAGGVPGGAGRMELSLQRHGTRTRIGRQFVSYPFHMTRPFALDAAIPQLLTIYQQSCSGGLFRGERLSNRFDLEPGAAAHITTQSATIVHDCKGQIARQSTDVSLSNGAFLALMPEPLVLFPGAACCLRLEASLSDGAVLVVTDSFARHDPSAHGDPASPGRVFQSYENEISIRDASGRLLVRDCSAVTGAALAGRHSPMGDWPIVSNFILAGDRTRLPTQATLTSLISRAGVAVGVTELPNQAGWGVRCLSRDAIVAREFSDWVFAASIFAAFGEAPAPRRK